MSDVTKGQDSAAEVPSAVGHTPGPWLASGGSVYALDESGQVNRFYVNVQPGYVIRTNSSATSVHTSYGELDANARLIAAAPDLLEALEDLLMHACIADASPDDKDEIDQSYERAARAAIAKALGRQREPSRAAEEHPSASV